MKIEKPKFLKKHEYVGIFPYPIRLLLIGPSGCGKTVLLYNIIINFWIPFTDVYIYTNTPHQQIYQELDKILKQSNIPCFISNNFDEIISPSDCELNSIVIFDDCLSEKQNKMEEYFTTSRHFNISCIYLAQSLTSLNVRLIRDNSNFICLFKNPRHIKRLYDETNIGIHFNDFRSYCGTCWKNDFGFLSIDKVSNRYINCFETFLV